MSNIIDSIQLSGTTYQIQGSGGGVPENVFTAYTASTDSRIGEDEEVTAAALNALDEKIDSISGGGNPTVEVTQAEYDAMVSAGTVSADTYYIITDAQAGDLTNYYTKTETNTLLGGKADTATTYTKTEVDNAITAATSTKQDTLVSGTNIKTINNTSILGSGNIDIQGGGGGGMTEDDELLLSTALTDLNDRKIDASEVKSNYQRKGDYVTTNTLNTRLADYETALDEQNVEEVTAYALNDLNERFGGLKIVKITESEYEALATKDENTLYVVVADPS